VQRHATCA